MFLKETGILEGARQNDMGATRERREDDKNS